MSKYHKIPTVYRRDPETRYRTLLEGQYAAPELRSLAQYKWEWTEKIDGTNIRIIREGGWTRYRGKTDQAQIPPHLLARLQDLFDCNPGLENLQDCVLYGEGFGNKIQKCGPLYLPDATDFALFDIRIGPFWLRRETVYKIAQRLGVRAVPVVGYGTLPDAVDYAKAGFDSAIGTAQSEGLIMRPEWDLCDRRGHRIITKIKRRDFEEGEK